MKSLNLNYNILVSSLPELMSVSSLSALPNPAFFFLVYVDDIIITGRKSYEVQSLISHLHMLFSLKDLGPLNFLLGIEVHKLHDGNFHLSQGKYVTDLLERAKMLNTKSMPTPMMIGTLLSAQLGNLMQDLTLYRSIVGALHYVPSSDLKSHIITKFVNSCNIPSTFIGRQSNEY